MGGSGVPTAQVGPEGPPGSVGVTAIRSERRWEIDWLRILAVLLLVPYHTARIFDTGTEFYVKNEVHSGTLTHWVIALGDAFGMQLLFLLAGAASWFALGVRSPKRYLIERTRRLLVPFLFGILVLVPPQTYLGIRSHGGYSGSFFGYYPMFFQFHGEDFQGYTQGGFTPAHLWFILFLLMFSVAALPLFRWLRGGSGERVVGWLARLAGVPGAIFLLGLPMLGVERLLDASDYEDPLLMLAYFLGFFLVGYLLMADGRFAAAIDRHRLAALLAGPALWVVLRVIPLDSRPDWFNWVLRSFYDRGLFTWFTMIAVLGYGRRHLATPNRLMAYFGEAGYPFYVLHQTVLVAIGYFVVAWNTGVSVKYLVVAVATFIGTTAIYEYGVRRTAVTRFLFGMRPAKSEPERAV